MSRIVAMPRRVISGWSLSPGVSTTIVRAPQRTLSTYLYLDGPEHTGGEISTTWQAQQWTATAGVDLGAEFTGNLPTNPDFGLSYADNPAHTGAVIVLPFSNGVLSRTYAGGLLDGITVSRAAGVSLRLPSPGPTTLYVRLFRMWKPTGSLTSTCVPLGTTRVGGAVTPTAARCSSYRSHDPNQWFADFSFLSGLCTTTYKSS